MGKLKVPVLLGIALALIAVSWGVVPSLASTPKRAQRATSQAVVAPQRAMGA